MSLDRRRHAFRDDLADARLRGRVEAACFVAGRPGRASLGVLPLKDAPDWEARLASELLYGETVHVFEEKGGWAWLQAESDGYVGYAPTDGIEMGIGAASTHRVTALATFLYADPDLKSMPLDRLPLGSDVTFTGEQAGGFAEVAGGGWLFAPHVTALTALGGDGVASAERFEHVPYLWGGKSQQGIDCSGLVQVALRAVGIRAPRDTDMQAAELGAAVDPDAPRRRGDLVYFPGHVGIMADAEILLHANAWSMTVAKEPLREVVTRGNLAITAVRRISPSR